jgi:hypothetical protein
MRVLIAPAAVAILAQPTIEEPAMDTSRLHGSVLPARDHGYLMNMFRETLSLGTDMDGRGLHWTLSADISPEQRLAFAFAVHFTGGRYVLVNADRGFICAERVVQQMARLKKARGHGSYRIGHAYAALYDALGYGCHETIGFALIEPGDLACVEGFIKGFGDALAQSLEPDVMRVICRNAGADRDVLIQNLRHFINDHETVVTVINDIV